MFRLIFLFLFFSSYTIHAFSQDQAPQQLKQNENIGDNAGISVQALQEYKAKVDEINTKEQQEISDLTAKMQEELAQVKAPKSPGDDLQDRENDLKQKLNESELTADQKEGLEKEEMGIWQPKDEISRKQFHDISQKYETEIEAVAKKYDDQKDQLKKDLTGQN